MRTALCVLAVVLAALPGPAWAETKVMEAEHVYVLGDGDTLADARKMCVLEAKRKLAEQAGQYVEVMSRTSDFQLAGDEVRSFSAAVIQAQSVKEEPVLAEGRYALRCVVRAEIDTDEVRRKLNEAGAQALARQRQAEQERAAAPGSAATPVPPGQAPVHDLETATRLAADHVQKGMTEAEVARAAGAPRARKVSGRADGEWVCLNYGRVWVVMEHGLVQCLRRRLSWSPRYKDDCHCEGLSVDFIQPNLDPPAPPAATPPAPPVREPEPGRPGSTLPRPERRVSHLFRG